MPTGYTAPIEDGTLTDFRTFALRCARAFGATIEQRDEAIDALPRERKIDTYYRTRVEEALENQKRLNAMTLTEAEHAAQVEYDKSVATREEVKREHALRAGRYATMLAEVEMWEPPTPEHEGLKRFMIEQITESLPRGGYPKVVKLTAKAWLADRRTRAEEEVERASKAFNDEKERVANANAWIRALYDSLAPVTR